MRRFEQMKAELAGFDLTVVALSKDTIEEARVHKTRDGLGLRLLADPELNVIRQYGVEHQKAFGFGTTKYQLFGIPLALTPSFKSMAIPTSLLVDEQGVIRWIDQAEDYRLRSDNARVMQAVKSVFGA